MAEERMSEEEARRLFVAELIRSSEEGPAPDCAEQLAAIDAEFDAACAAMRKDEKSKKRVRRR